MRRSPAVKKAAAQLLIRLKNAVVGLRWARVAACWFVANNASGSDGPDFLVDSCNLLGTCQIASRFVSSAYQVFLALWAYPFVRGRPLRSASFDHCDLSLGQRDFLH